MQAGWCRGTCCSFSNDTAFFNPIKSKTGHLHQDWFVVGAMAAALCININTDRRPIPVEKRLRPCNKPCAPHLLYVAFAICVSVLDPRRCVAHIVTGRSTMVRAP